MSSVRLSLVGSGSLTSVLSWLSELPDMPWTLEKEGDAYYISSTTRESTQQQSSYSLDQLLKRVEKCGYSCPTQESTSLREYWWRSVS